MSVVSHERVRAMQTSNSAVEKDNSEEQWNMVECLQPKTVLPNAHAQTKQRLIKL